VARRWTSATRASRQSPDLTGISPPASSGELDWIEHVTSTLPDRCFAFDRFGPLSMRPTPAAAGARSTRADRLPATYRHTHGIRCLTAATALRMTDCGESWARVRAAITPWRRSRPSARPDHMAPAPPSTRSWTTCPRTHTRRPGLGAAHKVELRLTPTYSFWATRSRPSSGRCAHSRWRTEAPRVPHTAGAYRPRPILLITVWCSGSIPRAGCGQQRVGQIESFFGALRRSRRRSRPATG
jgi:hypothetical protein